MLSNNMQKKAKLEMETLGKILLLTAFMIIFLIMFKGCKDSFSDVGMVGMKEYFCWGSNLINAEASSLFPTTCSPTIIEEDLEKTDISDLIRRCWWMYGKGELDLQSEGITEVGITDKVYTCYAFKPKEDISLISLREHMQDHTLGDKKAKKAEDAAWYYIQKGTKEEQAICFEKKVFLASEGILSAGKTYYINFYDEKVMGSQGENDRIMISRNSKFGEELVGIVGWVKSFFEKCYSIDEGAEKKAYYEYTNLLEEQKNLCSQYDYNLAFLREGKCSKAGKSVEECKKGCFSNLDKCVPYSIGISDYDICKPCIKSFDDSTQEIIPLVERCPDITSKELCNQFNNGGNLCGVDLKCKWEFYYPSGSIYGEWGCGTINIIK